MKAISSLIFLYGKHYPQGKQAFEYITGPDGTWRQFTPAQYIWNYYDNPTPVPENHPYNKSALISYADGTQLTTCRDANGHLLLDYNHDGELDTTEGKYAYFEHAGRGYENNKMGNPFSNFWFDDNSLAKFMNKAYDTDEPYGLSSYSEFIRWQIVGGDNSNWTPYSHPSGYIDQLALNGLYYLSSDNIIQAKKAWNDILDISSPSWNDATQQYDYPGVKENYYFGLLLTLTSFLSNLDSANSNLRQHWVSIRSSVLYNQVKNGSTSSNGPFFGWTSDVGNNGSLINTESVSTNVLGLGAGAYLTFEVGREPLLSEEDRLSNGYFLRDYNALSAVVGLSKPGYMIQGPTVDGYELTTGNYTLEIFIRSPSPVDNILTIDVLDSTNAALASSVVNASDFGSPVAVDWIVKSVPFSVAIEGVVGFKVYWSGLVNVDLSCIRVKKL